MGISNIAASQPDRSKGTIASTLFKGEEQRLRLSVNLERKGPENSALTLGGHEAAMQEIRSWPGYRLTPLVPLNDLAQNCTIHSLWYKDEGLRFGLGSFKALGGAYAVLRVLQKEVLKSTGRELSSGELRTGSNAAITNKVTVATATDGNHGRSVAWSAQMFGCQSVVYIPKSCSPAREAAIAHYGATVIRTAGGYDETVRICASESADKGFVVVSDTSWTGYSGIPRDVMNGYTVMVEEVLQQLPPGDVPTHVFIQGGVGGLAAAVYAHFWNRLGESAPLMVVVEPEGAACLFASAKAGKPTPAPPPVRTIMAGLDCGEVSPLAWDILSAGATAFATVPDDVVAPTMRLLAGLPEGRIVAGESAVAGLAALLIAAGDPDLRAGLKLDASSRVLVFGTEGNTDPEVYESLMKAN